MRLRLGLLQTPEAIDRQHAREAVEAAAKKAKTEIPTVKTEAQAKADEVSKGKEKDKGGEKAKPAKPRIRPLSEAKAIDSGANFISETFIFSVGLALILFENWRSRRKEQSRRNDVAEKLAELEDRDQAKEKALQALEQEVTQLRAKRNPARGLFSGGASNSTEPSSGEAPKAPETQAQKPERHVLQEETMDSRTNGSSSLFWPFSALWSIGSRTSASTEQTPKDTPKALAEDAPNSPDTPTPGPPEEESQDKSSRPASAVNRSPSM